MSARACCLRRSNRRLFATRIAPLDVLARGVSSTMFRFCQIEIQISSHAPSLTCCTWVFTVVASPLVGDLPPLSPLPLPQWQTKPRHHREARTCLATQLVVTPAPQSIAPTHAVALDRHGALGSDTSTYRRTTCSAINNLTCLPFAQRCWVSWCVDPTRPTSGGRFGRRRRTVSFGAIFENRGLRVRPSLPSLLVRRPLSKPTCNTLRP